MEIIHYPGSNDNRGDIITDEGDIVPADGDLMDYELSDPEQSLQEVLEEQNANYMKNGEHTYEEYVHYLPSQAQELIREAQEKILELEAKRWSPRRIDSVVNIWYNQRRSRLAVKGIDIRDMPDFIYSAAKAVEKYAPLDDLPDAEVVTADFGNGERDPDWRERQQKDW